MKTVKIGKEINGEVYSMFDQVLGSRSYFVSLTILNRFLIYSSSISPIFGVNLIIVYTWWWNINGAISLQKIQFMPIMISVLVPFSSN